MCDRFHLKRSAISDRSRSWGAAAASVGASRSMRKIILDSAAPPTSARRTRRMRRASHVVIAAAARLRLIGVEDLERGPLAAEACAERFDCVRVLLFVLLARDRRQSAVIADRQRGRN